MSSGPLSLAVLRLGFRPQRDGRVNTHLALTARALGAEVLYVSGQDPELETSMEGVARNFGGEFRLVVERSWRGIIRNYQGVRVHLTMYGDNLNSRIEAIKGGFREEGRLLVVVGGEKVPKEVYGMVDFNIAVGNQPHSEIAALAVFLDRLQEGLELEREFGGRLHIEAYRDGKKQVLVREDP